MLSWMARAYRSSSRMRNCSCADWRRSLHSLTVWRRNRRAASSSTPAVSALTMPTPTSVGGTSRRGKLACVIIPAATTQNTACTSTVSETSSRKPSMRIGKMNTQACHCLLRPVKAMASPYCARM